MNILVLRERNLGGVQTNRDSAFIGIERTTVGSCGHGAVTAKVRVGVFRNQGSVLNVGVAKGGNFIARLHRVGERVIVVVHVIW